MSVHILVRAPYPNPRTIVVCDECGYEARMPSEIDDAPARRITALMWRWWTDDKDRDLCGDCYIIHGTASASPTGILNGPNR